jgi:hypothetical protein
VVIVSNDAGTGQAPRFRWAATQRSRLVGYWFQVRRDANHADGTAAGTVKKSSRNSGVISND